MGHLAQRFQLWLLRPAAHLQSLGFTCRARRPRTAQRRADQDRPPTQADAADRQHSRLNQASRVSRHTPRLDGRQPQSTRRCGDSVAPLAVVAPVAPSGDSPARTRATAPPCRTGHGPSSAAIRVVARAANPTPRAPSAHRRSHCRRPRYRAHATPARPRCTPASPSGQAARSGSRPHSRPQSAGRGSNPEMVQVGRGHLTETVRGHSKRLPTAVPAGSLSKDSWRDRRVTPDADDRQPSRGRTLGGRSSPG